MHCRVCVSVGEEVVERRHPVRALEVARVFHRVATLKRLRASDVLRRRHLLHATGWASCLPKVRLSVCCVRVEAEEVLRPSAASFRSSVTY